MPKKNFSTGTGDLARNHARPVPFLIKDVVLLAVSIYLLKQDVMRLLEAGPSAGAALSQA